MSDAQKHALCVSSVFEPPTPPSEVGGSSQSGPEHNLEAQCMFKANARSSDRTTVSLEACTLEGEKTGLDAQGLPGVKAPPRR